MSTFGELLKELRKEHRISQRALSEQIGVDFTYISKIETGAMPPPSQEVIEKMAKVLHADPEQMILAAKKVPVSFQKTISQDELATLFLRKFDTLTEEKKDRIRSIISDDGDDDA